MKAFSGFGPYYGERMERIAAVNAHHIIDTLPRRLYHHDTWGTLEYSTLLLPTDPEKGRRIMIGICYNDMREIKVATYILYEDGSMYMYDNDRSQKLPYGICYAHLHMLLSEESLYGWAKHNYDERKKGAKATGISLEEPAIAHQQMLYKTMEQVREVYAQLG